MICCHVSSTCGLPAGQSLGAGLILTAEKLDFHIVQTQSRRLDLSADFRGLFCSRSVQQLPSGDRPNVRGTSVFTILRFIVSEGINMSALLLNLICSNIAVFFFFRCCSFFWFCLQ